MRKDSKRLKKVSKEEVDSTESEDAWSSWPPPSQAMMAQEVVPLPENVAAAAEAVAMLPSETTKREVQPPPQPSPMLVLSSEVLDSSLAPIQESPVSELQEDVPAYDSWEDSEGVAVDAASLEPQSPLAPLAVQPRAVKSPSPAGAPMVTAPPCPPPRPIIASAQQSPGVHQDIPAAAAQFTKAKGAAQLQLEQATKAKPPSGQAVSPLWKSCAPWRSQSHSEGQFRPPDFSIPEDASWAAMQVAP